MPNLTLQEVIDRVNEDRLNKNNGSKKESRKAKQRIENQAHRPEFYVPRITRLFVSLLFGA